MSVVTPSAGPPGNSLAQAYVDRCFRLGAAIPPNLLAAEDVPYGPHPRDRLDVYRPEGDVAGLPVLVFLHGGGFTSGGKDWCRFMATVICAQPAVLVCPSHRLMPETPVTDQAAAVAAALAWTTANIARYGGDPDRLVVGGHSAGAALAILLAVDQGPAPPAVLDRIRAVVCISATLHQFAVTGTREGGYALPPGPLRLDPASPLAKAERLARPLLIAWGGLERQRERVERSSMAMIGALRDAGRRVEWLFRPGLDHFETHLALADPRDPLTLAVGRWLAGEID